MKKKLAFIFILNALMVLAENQNINLGQTIIKSNIGFDETLQSTPKNIQVITSEEIAEKNYKNVTEILEKSPLVTIKNDAMGQTIEMRGSGLNSKGTVQVMIDGMAINPVDINHGTLPLNSIPVSNIDKVEILPGGNGVLFGDGATGGVVNIITKAGIDKTESYIGARYGSNSERIFKAGTATKINDDFSVLINYQNENSKTNRSGERDKNYNIDVTALAKFDEKSDFSLRYGHYERELSTADLLTRDEWKSDSRQSGVDFDGSELQTTEIKMEMNGRPVTITATPLVGSTDMLSKSKIERDDIALNYRREISDRLDFNLTTNWQKTTNDIHQRESTYRNFAGETINGNYIPGKSGMAYHTYYADWIGTFTEEKFKINPSLKYEYSGDSYLIVGYDYKLQKSKRDFDNYIDMYKVYNLDSEKESHGAYIFNKTTIGQFEFMQGYRREWTEFDTTKTTHYYHKVTPVMPAWGLPTGYVDTGLSSDKIKKSMVNDSYEFAVNYLYSDTGNIYTRFEQSFRTPAPTEFQDKKNNEYALNDLEAETNQTLEIGIKDYIYGSNIQLNLFAGRTKDEIYYNEVSHGSDWSYDNLDETRRLGIELSLDQDYGKFFFFEGISYIDAEINKDSDKSIEGNQIPYTSKFNANIGGGVRWNNNFNTILTLNYKDKYYLDRANQYKARSFITLDLTANYIFNNGLKLFAGINNLLDRQNFDQEAIENGVQVYDPSIERSYYAGFEYKF